MENIENLIKKNGNLKRKIILNEIDIENYKELLLNSDVKYYNLNTGDFNNIDKKYFENIKKINNENEKKMFEIDLKFEKKINKIKFEHEKIIKNLKEKNEEIECKKIIENLETKIKTLNEKIFNNEKINQILNKKYENLIEENNYLKNKIKFEKENLIFLIEKLENNHKLNYEKFYEIFENNQNLILKNFNIEENNNKENVEF